MRLARVEGTMSDTEESGESAVTVPGGVKANVPVLPLMAAVIVGVLTATAGVGGVLFWAIKSGKLPMGGIKTVEVQKVAPLPTKLVPMDPLLVNLADDGGRSYLRVGLTLRVEDPPPEKGAKPKEEKPDKAVSKNENEAVERDVALSVLGKETSEQLLSPYGKEEMKRLLKDGFKDRVPEVKVEDVLVTEFLIQK